MTALFNADRHENLLDRPWDENIASATRDTIVDDTIGAFSFDGLWPIHPMDRSPERADVLTPLYYGAAGVVWALKRLGRLTDEIAAALTEITARNRRDGPSDAASFLLGSAGIELLGYTLGIGEVEAVEQALARGTEQPANGLVWGRAGSALNALHLHRATGRAASREIFHSILRSLVDEWLEIDDGVWLWRAPLYGHTDHMLSALHGMASNIAPFVVGRDVLPRPLREVATQRIGTTLERTAERDGVFANWPLVHGESTRPTGRTTRFLQHCNGAPGIVNVFGAWPDARFDPLLIGAGELIWAAGPLVKRPSLCHGVPGSGFAFLRLFERTGDERWLDRARRFAMHAIVQDRDALATTKQRKFSLWTGDLGLAVYLDHCLTAEPGFPTVDYF